MPKLAESEIESISLWILVMVAVIGGLFAGFLGGGAGYVRMPLLVYVLGVPTKGCRGHGPFRSRNLSQLRHDFACHQAKCGYYDCAGDAHRRSRWSADRNVLTQFFRGPANSLGLLTFAASGAALVVHGLVTGHQMK